MYKYFIVFLLGIMVAGAVFLSVGQKQSGQNSLKSPAKSDSKGLYVIGMLGYSQSILNIFSEVENQLNILAGEKKFEVEYKKITNANTVTDVKNALDFFQAENVQLIITGQSQAVNIKKLGYLGPVIVSTSASPVEMGLADSELGSGNNFVFVDGGNFLTAGERLRLYLSMVPKTKKVLVLRGALEVPGESLISMPLIQAVARQNKVDIIDKSFSSRKELNEYILNTNFQDIDAVFRYPGPFMAANMDVVFGLESKINKPIITLTQDELERGGVLSYSPDAKDLAKLTVEQINSILIKGIAPAKIPVVHTYKYNLGVNRVFMSKYNIKPDLDFSKKVDYIIEK